MFLGCPRPKTKEIVLQKSVQNEEKPTGKTDVKPAETPAADSGTKNTAKPAPPPKPVLADEKDIAAAVKRLDELRGTYQKAPNGAVTALSVRFKGELSFADFGLFATLLDLESIELLGPEVNDEGFSQLSPLKNLKTIIMENATITKASFEVMRDSFPELTRLNARRVELGNDGVEVISQMKKLTHLELMFNNFDQFGLKFIGEMAQLKVLDIRGCQFVQNLIYLRKLQNLQVIKLRNPIQDKSIEHISKCENLQAVDLQDMDSVTDASGVFLAAMGKLRDLSLFRMPNLTDEILKHLEGKSLQRLTLRDMNGITDEGIAVLKSMQELTRLDLSEVRSVTDAGIREALEGNTKITNLVLWNIPELTDETGRVLATMTGLKELEIRELKGVTGKTLEAVATLPKLESLTVGDSGYSLDDLEKLEKSASLRKLTIYGGQAEVEAIIAKIQPKMPNCKMTFMSVGVH